jgi:hypothetical protein
LDHSEADYPLSGIGSTTSHASKFFNDRKMFGYSDCMGNNAQSLKQQTLKSHIS